MTTVHHLPPVKGFPLEWREGVRWEPGVVTIDDSYGVRPAYRVKAACGNCSWAGEIRRQKGHQPRTAYPCPDCGCHAVRSLNVLAGVDSTSHAAEHGEPGAAS